MNRNLDERCAFDTAEGLSHLYTGEKRSHYRGPLISQTGRDLL